MTTTNPDLQDIRSWAVAQGLDVKPKGKIPLAVMDAWNRREVPPDDAGSGDGTVGETVPDGAPGGDSPETRPATGLKPWWKKQSKADRPARPTHRRVSTENLVSGAWGLGAWMLSRAQNGGLLPVARCLDMQAPVAGIVINDVTKGTPLDKVLQPLARLEEKGGKVGALFGPPVLVTVITLNPALHDPLLPLLKLSVMSWMEVSEPAMKKLATRQARFEEKIGVSASDVDAMIAALFAPPPGPEVWSETMSEQEEENIRRARGGA